MRLVTLNLYLERITTSTTWITLIIFIIVVDIYMMLSCNFLLGFGLLLMQLPACYYLISNPNWFRDQIDIKEVPD